ncbi:hypothetical protein [uncultured Sphingomonas sp.]|uniref:hypothetical protein n=1 Tax=uncultured Sphingomonas sp. TaxID=158754 RepID=UPI0025EDC1E2|nr:hypothetical protein [uncultured Sphingomonas sp.]
MAKKNKDKQDKRQRKDKRKAQDAPALPKELRAVAGVVTHLVNSPLAREVAAAALVAAASALVVRRDDQDPAGAARGGTGWHPEQAGANLANLLVQGVSGLLRGGDRSGEGPSTNKAPSAPHAKPKLVP